MVMASCITVSILQGFSENKITSATQLKGMDWSDCVGRFSPARSSFGWSSDEVEWRGLMFLFRGFTFCCFHVVTSKEW